MAVPDVNRTEKPVDLPGSLGELRQYYRVKPAEGSTSLEGRWDKVWTKYPVAAASRDDAVASVPYAQTWEDKAPTTPESREEELALGALKVSATDTSPLVSAVPLTILPEICCRPQTVLSTPDETYREEEGDAMLKPFEAHIDKLVEDLREKGLIVKAERDEARRIPGRNFAFTDKCATFDLPLPICLLHLLTPILLRRYLNRFGARIDLSHLQEASLYEQDLMASAEGVFPLAPMSGEMMAFFDLLSEGKASLSIDTSTLTDKALDVRDYTTRQASESCGRHFFPSPRKELMMIWDDDVPQMTTTSSARSTSFLRVLLRLAAVPRGRSCPSRSSTSRSSWWTKSTPRRLLFWRRIRLHPLCSRRSVLRAKTAFLTTSSW